jgi:hypothetical protein
MYVLPFFVWNRLFIWPFTRQLSSINSQIRAQDSLPAFFLVKRSGLSVSVAKVEEYESFFQGVPVEEVSHTLEPVFARPFLMISP